VIEVLQDRVTLAEELDSLNGYNPLPFHWDNSLRVREHSSFAEQLQYLHAWLADKPDSLLRREFGAELFEAVAGRYDEPVLTVLAEALDSPNVADVQAVAAVVRKAHRTLIWDAPEFVVQALHAADRLGEEFRSEMASAFWSATITGGRSGAVGQPYPEDIEQRDESTRVAESLAKGSIEEDFYRAMVRSAEQSISRSALEDLHDDGRDW
jgi:hypothetical protein